MTMTTHPALPSVSNSHPRVSPAEGAVSGTPLVLLRLESAAVLVAATFAYSRLGAGWTWFAALFLVPDLSMLGYLGGRRLGAACYNVGHSYLGPAALAALAVATSMPMLLGIACIWIAHIGFDRLLGYGLKYTTSFGETHLGRRGANGSR
jgi:Domain of unknown function (DUF4260)